MMLPNVMPEEISYLDGLTKDLTPEQQKSFITWYATKRKDPQTILLLCLIGLVAVAGIHRFVLGQIGMGILYLLTGGLCLIGTIVDAVNHKKLTWEYNITMANETLMLIKR
ncbi:MAG: TM2 domain-containing protein [Chitinophagales bacterium]|nr:TM2 domain-containing protein [Chitinophagales bacterium]